LFVAQRNRWRRSGGECAFGDGAGGDVAGFWIYLSTTVESKNGNRSSINIQSAPTHAYQINFAQTLSKMKHTVVALIRFPISAVKDVIEKTVDYISLSMEPIRKGRQFQRRMSSVAVKDFHSSYKRAL